MSLEQLKLHLSGGKGNKSQQVVGGQVTEDSEPVIQEVGVYLVRLWAAFEGIFPGEWHDQKRLSGAN